MYLFFYRIERRSRRRRSSSRRASMIRGRMTERSRDY